MVETLQLVMAAMLFILGAIAIVTGLWTILSREYQETLKGISTQSARISTRALTEAGFVPLVEASARLIEAVNGLIRTAVGVGVFLCIIGTGLCTVAYWITTR
jgi:hypothetical protein